MKVIRTCDLLSTKYSLRNTYSFNTFSTNVALLYPPPENIRKPSVKYLGYYISPGSSRLDKCHKIPRKYKLLHKITTVEIQS